MDISRRRLLRVGSTAGLMSLAGCGNDSKVRTEETETTTPSDEPATNTPSDETTTTTPQEQIFELGETAIFDIDENRQLAITPSAGERQNLLIYSQSNYVYSEAPEQSDYVYLLIPTTLENRGSENIRPPQSVLLVDGTQYDHSYTTTYQDSSYSSSNEIRPGAKRSVWMIFGIPKSEANAQLLVDFQTFSNTMTAKWEFELADLTLKQIDFSNLNPGSEARLGTDSTQFSITAQGVEETQSYTYESGNYEFEETAGEGNKFILVSMRAENTGDSSVYVPTAYDLSLIANQSQFESSTYLKSNKYEGGEIGNGIVREGKVQFEVPTTINSYRVVADLTNHLNASWQF